MTSVRRLTIAYALGRAAFGAGLLAPPSWVAERWIGRDAERPPVQAAVRGLAARDIALSAGAIDAARWGAPLLAGASAAAGAALALSGSR